MSRSARSLPGWTLCLGLSLVVQNPAWSQQPAGEALSFRLLDGSAERVRQQPELAAKVGDGFGRDSLSIYTLRGLRFVDDSTLIAWFGGLSTAVDRLEGPACAGIASAPPTSRNIVEYVGVLDSASAEEWLRSWNKSVTAAFVGTKRPPVADSAMVTILFGLVASLAQQPDSLGGQPECRKLHNFLDTLLALPWDERVTVFRGLSEHLNGKKKPSK